MASAKRRPEAGNTPDRTAAVRTRVTASSDEEAKDAEAYEEAPIEEGGADDVDSDEAKDAYEPYEEVPIEEDGADEAEKARIESEDEADEAAADVAWHRNQGMPFVNIGDVFELGGTSFTRRGSRSCSCGRCDRTFGMHSYNQRALTSHARSCTEEGQEPTRCLVLQHARTLGSPPCLDHHADRPARGHQTPPQRESLSLSLLRSLSHRNSRINCIN